jgi:hypothetical protein
MRRIGPRRAFVGIPVRDEAERLPRLLDALAGQKVGDGRTLTVCFLLDGCRDGSEAFLREQMASLPFDMHIKRLPLAEPNAGRARRAAMQFCLNLMGREEAALLTTDADSVPEVDWVEASCRALGEVDVVAGHIERSIRLMGCWRTRLEDYLMALHEMRRTIDPIAYDPAPGHPSTGGASLGFRSDVYRALGGFPEFVRGEDTALVAKARRSGYRVRHDRAVKVITSNRTAGRVPGGLADELRQQLAAGPPPLVGDPAVLMKHYRLQAALRQAWEGGPRALASAANRYGWCEAYFREVAAVARTSDAFVETVAPDDGRAKADVLPLPAAVEALRHLRLPALEQAAVA